MSNAKCQYVFPPWYLKGILFYRTTENKMATWAHGCKTFFDNSESKYKLWEVKFLGYLRIQHLHQVILSPTDQSDDMDFIEKNAPVFAERIQYLDDKSLSLVKSYFLLYRANVFVKIGISLLQTI